MLGMCCWLVACLLAWLVGWEATDNGEDNNGEATNTQVAHVESVSTEGKGNEQSIEVQAAQIKPAISDDIENDGLSDEEAIRVDLATSDVNGNECTTDEQDVDVEMAASGDKKHAHDEHTAHAEINTSNKREIGQDTDEGPHRYVCLYSVTLTAYLSPDTRGASSQYNGGRGTSVRRDVAASTGVAANRR